jgi:hypothetical protein
MNRIVDNYFPYPLNQEALHIPAERSPSPIDVLDVPFEQFYFNGVVDHLVKLRGEATGFSSQLSSTSPSGSPISSPPPTTRPELHASNANSQAGVTANPMDADASTQLTATYPSLARAQLAVVQDREASNSQAGVTANPMDADASTQLTATYPSLARALAVMQDQRYREAYRSCFRIRVYKFIMDDLPSNLGIGREEVVSWVGVKSDKTFRNMSSRYNNSVASLRWLQRSRNSLDKEQLFKLRVLTKILDSPLEPLSLNPQDMDIETDMEEDEISRRNFKSVYDTAVGLAARQLDAWNTDIKKLSRS